MNLCYRKCGLPAYYVNKNGQFCCSMHPASCPTVKQKIGQGNSSIVQQERQKFKKIQQSNLLCHRGCGQIGTYLNKKGFWCCNKITQKCQVVKDKIGKANSIVLQGRTLSDHHRSQIAKGNTGRIVSEETRKKIKESCIKTKELNPKIPWNKGKTGSQIPWNKGLRKKEPIEILSREDPAYQDFKKYRNRVSVRTRKNYELFKEEINPNNFPLGKCGVPGAYQIDHIISVRLGFEKMMSIEEISAKENLQVLPWRENVQKYDGKK